MLRREEGRKGRREERGLGGLKERKGDEENGKEGDEVGRLRR